MHETNSLPAELRRLADAPHRLLFFIGAGNVLLSMAWWTFWLANARWFRLELPQLAVPAGWLHAFILQYQVLPTFIFGFLLTVFPRWMGLPAYSRWHYVPVGLGLLGGQLLTLAAIVSGLPHLLFLGLLMTLAGWLSGMVSLALRLWREPGITWHAVSAWFALAFGLAGLVLMLAYGFTSNPQLASASIKLGSFGLLLPMYFTVCHRMLPFFANAALPGYTPYRTMWALLVCWLLALLHLALELTHHEALLWLADLPLMLLGGFLLWRWWPRGHKAPALLRVLLYGFAWLPVAAALYSVQSLILWQSGDYLLGRAPAHALFIGFYGSLLVAMVTRVTQGHSGRPLQFGVLAGLAFILLQVTAIVRILAETREDAFAWLALAGALWLLAFLPWAARAIWIYLTPRADGQPG